MVAGFGATAFAQNPADFFSPNNLVVSRSVYDSKAGNVKVGQVLPPNRALTTAGCPTGTAQYDGTYPTIFNNDLIDGTFGITSPIYLDQIRLVGKLVNSLEVPNSDIKALPNTDHLVTSFSSESELALNLSTNGRQLTFMGYVAPMNTLDVSTSNAPVLKNG